jgi:4,5-DOPA dioxygenase extradiol
MYQKMPTLFIAHGSPMNAIEQNSFTKALTHLNQKLPRPKAILVISAHWRTPGTRVLNTAFPKTIHDFGGFPPALYEVQYKAPGAPDIAARVAQLLSKYNVQEDSQWGFDHGTWSVIRHIFPAAEIPVLQLSIDKRLDLEGHANLARDLVPLRNEGVLILGSGNITHNLGEVDFNEGAKPPLWAIEFDQLISVAIQHRDRDFLVRRSHQETAALWRRALPTYEHYIPLLYAYGASESDDFISFPYEGFQNGTLSMRCVQFGQ